MPVALPPRPSAGGILGKSAVMGFPPSVVPVSSPIIMTFIRTVMREVYSADERNILGNIFGSVVVI